MNETPIVGLVMPAFNSRLHLAEAVASVQQQQMSNFLCCIVDDGSIDGTCELARQLTSSDARFTVLEQPHKGQTFAQNYGVSNLPMTKYLCFPDSDDVWYPEALSTLIEAAESPGVIGAHGLANQIDANGAPYLPGEFQQWSCERIVVKYLRRRQVPLENATTFATLVSRCTVYPPGLWIVRRDIFDIIGGFETRFGHFEDWNIQIRASRHGDFAFVNKVIVDYRMHDNQMHHSSRRIAAHRAISAAAATSVLNSPSQRASARSAWRGTEFYYALYRCREILHNPTRVVRLGLQVGLHFLRTLVGPRRALVPDPNTPSDTTRLRPMI